MNTVPNIAITHTFGAGGTSLTQELEKRIPYEKRIVTYDAARHYLRKNGLNANDTNTEQKVELQLFVIASSIGAVMQSTRSGIMALMDNSLIETIPYCEGLPIGKDVIDKVYDLLLDYHKHTVSYVIPPTIPLENDGLRHNDKEFRIAIHEKVMHIIEKFQIPHKFILSEGPARRAKEILTLHNNQ